MIDAFLLYLKGRLPHEVGRVEDFWTNFQAKYMIPNETIENIYLRMALSTSGSQFSGYLSLLSGQNLTYKAAKTLFETFTKKFKQDGIEITKENFCADKTYRNAMKRPLELRGVELKQTRERFHIHKEKLLQVILLYLQIISKPSPWKTVSIGKKIQWLR